MFYAPGISGSFNGEYHKKTRRNGYAGAGYKQ